MSIRSCTETCNSPPCRNLKVSFLSITTAITTIALLGSLLAICSQQGLSMGPISVSPGNLNASINYLLLGGSALGTVLNAGLIISLFRNPLIKKEEKVTLQSPVNKISSLKTDSEVDTTEESSDKATLESTTGEILLTEATQDPEATQLPNNTSDQTEGSDSESDAFSDGSTSEKSASPCPSSQDLKLSEENESASKISTQNSQATEITPQETREYKEIFNRIHPNLVLPQQTYMSGQITVDDQTIYWIAFRIADRKEKDAKTKKEFFIPYKEEVHFFKSSTTWEHTEIFTRGFKLRKVSESSI